MTATALPPPPPAADTEDAVVRKVMWRLIPFTVVLYLMNYIDRTNVAIAKLGMKNDVPGFDDAVFAFGASVFFIGYFIFEVPSNLIQEKVGPRRWLARIMISWGLISTCFMFVQGPMSFYVLRFLLGVAEAGFMPGMILYLSYWIPARQRAKAGAYFLTSTAIAGVIGNPLGGFILYATEGWHFAEPYLHRPWQWLFLLEGVPTVILGIVTLFYLTDQPRDARWLTAAERDWLTARMAHERHAHPSGHAGELRHAFTNPKVWLLGALYSLIMFAFYTVIYWTPTISKQALRTANLVTEAMPEHVVSLWVGLVSAIPFTFAVIGMLLISWNSDHTGERRAHVALGCVLGAVGLGLAAAATGWGTGLSGLVLTIAGLSIAGAGIWGTLGPFWTLPPHLLTGAAAAAGIALVNSLGNLGGGFVGPNVIGELKKLCDDSAWGGLLLSALVALGAAVMVLLTRLDRHAPPAFPIDPNAEEQQAAPTPREDSIQ